MHSLEKKLTISDYLPIYWKRICSIGNRWHHNFGDELILIGLIRLLNEKCKINNVKLYVSGGDLGFLKKFHSYFFTQEEQNSITYIQEIPHGIRSWLSFLTFKLLNFLTYIRCDVFIIWGGELFTEETPGSYFYRFRSLIPYWIRKIFLRNTKLYIMWGMQAPKAWYNKLVLKLILKAANGCFMRDEESVQFIVKSLQLTSKHCELWTVNWKLIEWFIDTSYFAIPHPDPLPTVHSAPLHSLGEGDPVDPIVNSKLSTDNWNKHIVINTNPLSRKWTQELHSIIEDYCKRWYEIYFLPAFFTRNPQQDDMKCFHELKSDYSYIQLLDWRDWDKFLSIFQSSDKIFCSRLHVFLIASFLWIEVQPYAYQKKIDKNIKILKKCWIIK